MNMDVDVDVGVGVDVGVTLYSMVLTPMQRLDAYLCFYWLLDVAKVVSNSYPQTFLTTFLSTFLSTFLTPHPFATSRWKTAVARRDSKATNNV